MVRKESKEERVEKHELVIRVALSGTKKFIEVLDRAPKRGLPIAALL